MCLRHCPGNISCMPGGGASAGLRTGVDAGSCQPRGNVPGCQESLGGGLPAGGTAQLPAAWGTLLRDTGSICLFSSTFQFCSNSLESKKQHKTKFPRELADAFLRGISVSQDSCARSLRGPFLWVLVSARGQQGLLRDGAAGGGAWMGPVPSWVSDAVPEAPLTGRQSVCTGGRSPGRAQVWSALPLPHLARGSAGCLLCGAPTSLGLHLALSLPPSAGWAGRPPSAVTPLRMPTFRACRPGPGDSRRATPASPLRPWERLCSQFGQVTLQVLQSPRAA